MSAASSSSRLLLMLGALNLTVSIAFGAATPVGGSAFILTWRAFAFAFCTWRARP